MELLQNFWEWVRTLQSSDGIVSFADDQLLRIVYVGLAFGFATLLVEIKLPLKYYWQLPQHIIKRTLITFGLWRDTPVWGYCVDVAMRKSVPLAAIELINPETQEVEKITFSNRLGQYGFRIRPGLFVIRAIKNYYVAPPFFDPENIRLQSTDASFAEQIEVSKDGWPQKDLLVQAVAETDATNPHSFIYFFRAFSINLANGFLIISILGSLYGWIVTQVLLYGVLLVVGIVFMFIKVYILEAVGSASSN